MKQLFALILAFVQVMYMADVYGQTPNLIAHRGGVVDSTFTDSEFRQLLRK